MNIKKIKDEEIDKHFLVTVAAKTIRQKYDEELSKIRSKGNFNGYRKGKIPVKIIESKFGQEIYSDISKQTIQEELKKLFNDKLINPASQPQVDIQTNELDKDINIDLKVECIPNIILPDFKKINLDYPVPEIKDIDVDLAIKSIADNNKDYVAKKGKVANGDQVIIDFKGRIGKKEFKGGQAKNHTLEIGSKTMIEGFEEQIIGHKVGDMFTINVTFPKDYGVKELAGKKSEFDIFIHTINTAKKPEINDALAKKIGSKDLTELKDKVKNMIISNYQDQIYLILKMKLFDEFEKILNFNLPKSLFDKEYNAVKSEFIKNKDNTKSKNKTNITENIEKKCEKVANRRVRIGLMIGEFAKKHSISVSKKDTYNAIMKKSQAMPEHEKILLEFYQKNPQAIEALQGTILEDKVVSIILDQHITKIEKKMIKKDLDKLIDKENKKIDI